MYQEYPSNDEISEARRKSISQSIRPISIEELRELGKRIFTDTSDPWYDNYSTFIGEHAGAKFYHATTSDRFEVVYCPEANKGIWIFEGLGKGRIRPENLELLKKIVDGL